MPENNIEKEILKSPEYISKKIEQTSRNVDKLFVEQRKAVFARFPLLFTLLGVFGFVATLYGFERLMDQLGLSDNPIILLLLGIGILILTGTLYKSLET